MEFDPSSLSKMHHDRLRREALQAKLAELGEQAQGVEQRLEYLKSILLGPHDLVAQINLGQDAEGVVHSADFRTLSIEPPTLVIYSFDKKHDEIPRVTGRVQFGRLFAVEGSPVGIVVQPEAFRWTDDKMDLDAREAAVAAAQAGLEAQQAMLGSLFTPLQDPALNPVYAARITASIAQQASPDSQL